MEGEITMRDIFDDIMLEEKKVFGTPKPMTQEEANKRKSDDRLAERIKRDVMRSVRSMIQNMAPQPMKEAPKEKDNSGVENILMKLDHLKSTIKEDGVIQDLIYDVNKLKSSSNKKEESSVVTDLLYQIEDLKKTLQEQETKLKDLADHNGTLVVPVAPVIPNWTASNGKVLTNNGDQLRWGDIAASTGVFYFGDETLEGTWRIIVDGNNLAFQKLTSGTWVEKGAMTA